MSAAARLIEDVDAEIYRVVDATPAKELAQVVHLEPRYLRALKYREQRPSSECRVEFGFAFPSVGAVWLHYVQRMTQPDFFDHDTQRAFHRDLARAGKPA